MHLKKLILPVVVLHLPLSRHAAAPITFFVKQEVLEALGNLLTYERDTVLDELVLLRILHHETEVFANLILHNWLDWRAGSCHFNEINNIINL